MCCGDGRATSVQCHCKYSCFAFLEGEATTRHQTSVQCLCKYSCSSFLQIFLFFISSGRGNVIKAVAALGVAQHVVAQHVVAQHLLSHGRTRAWSACDTVGSTVCGSVRANADRGCTSCTLTESQGDTSLRGGVTRQGVVLTDLQSLLDCQ